MRPVHWPAEEQWAGVDLFVYGHTHSQDLTAIDVEGVQRAFVNTGTWTRKVIRIATNLKLPPVFVPTYELSYVTVDRAAAGITVRLWERPKGLEYRLPWTERLATLGRRRPPLRPADTTPRVAQELTLPFRPDFGGAVSGEVRGAVTRQRGA